MKNIILIGMKGCGKTTVGKVLAGALDLPFVELDTEIEKEHERGTNKRLTCREIFMALGQDFFRALETRTLRKLMGTILTKRFVLTCGGGTPLRKKNQTILSKLGTLVFLDVPERVLLKRIVLLGIPAFFPFPDDPKKSLAILQAQRVPVYKKLATLTTKIANETPVEVSKIIMERIKSL